MWRKSMEHQRDAFLKRVYDLRSSNKRIVAIGAAAKGNTVLTYYGLNRFVVDCLTDASPTKQGKFTPLTRVPIVADSELSRYPDGVYAIVLAWNISELLRANLSALNSRIAYLDLPGAK
jgi:methylation protein EvaC